ncbi:MAG: hypothetical protein EZS28_020022, partial [Streblomastix strix]
MNASGQQSDDEDEDYEQEGNEDGDDDEEQGNEDGENNEQSEQDEQEQQSSQQQEQEGNNNNNLDDDGSQNSEKMKKLKKKKKRKKKQKKFLTPEEQEYERLMKIERQRKALTPEICAVMDPHRAFEILIDPLPERHSKKKRPIKKRKIKGVGAPNPRAKTAEQACREALDPIADDDDEEDTEEEDPEARGICRIQSMTLASNNITEKGSKVLAISLKNNRFLTTLDLSHNRIGFIGGQAIAEMLAENEILAKLNLCDCKVGAQGMKMIGKALGKNINLVQLLLSQNAILDEGAIAIAEGIGSNKLLQLSEIDLSSNGISDIGGVQFANQLAYNCSNVNLSSNELENETVTSFIASLRTNTLLTQIDLRFNNSAHILVMAMDELLEQNKIRRKETFPARLSLQLDEIRADVQRVKDLQNQCLVDRKELQNKLIELINQRRELEETKKVCAEKEAVLMAEIESNAKLMQEYQERAQQCGAEVSKLKVDGDFKMRSLGMKITKTQALRDQATKKRIKIVAEIETEGNDEVEKKAQEEKEKEKKEKEDQEKSSDRINQEGT